MFETKGEKMESAVFSAPDIECGGCASSIKNALGRVNGVGEVEVDINAKTVTVQFTPSDVSSDAIVAALDRAGFPAARIE